MADHPMHERIDAIIMSGSALQLMAHQHYQQWRVYAQLERQATIQGETFPKDIEFYKRCRERHEEVLATLCEKIDDAMQYIGDCGNAIDLVDEHQMTDSAFAAMNRAMGRDEMQPSEGP